MIPDERRGYKKWANKETEECNADVSKKNEAGPLEQGAFDHVGTTDLDH